MIEPIQKNSSLYANNVLTAKDDMLILRRRIEEMEFTV